MPAERKCHRRNYNIAGHAHELTFSCYRRFAFLRSERTCHWLAEAIRDARRTLAFDLWAYVFMPDHVHLIIWPWEADYDIAQIRSAIKQPVARRSIAFLRRESPEWIEKLTRRRGKRTETLFWQSGGGYDRNIMAPRTLARMIDYLHLNPVRKGFVANAADWLWSSARWYLGRVAGPLAIDPIPAEWVDLGMSDG
jgi:REP-associated tyrosine transposase